MIISSRGKAENNIHIIYGIGFVSIDPYDGDRYIYIYISFDRTCTNRPTVRPACTGFRKSAPKIHSEPRRTRSETRPAKTVVHQSRFGGNNCRSSSSSSSVFNSVCRRFYIVPIGEYCTYSRVK